MANEHLISRKDLTVAVLVERLAADPTGYQDPEKPPLYGIDMIDEYAAEAADSLEEAAERHKEFIRHRRTIINIATLAAMGVASMTLLAGSSNIESPVNHIAPVPVPVPHVNLDIAPSLHSPTLEQHPPTTAF